MTVPKHNLTCPEEILDRKCIAIVLMGILVLGIFFTGCTQPSGTISATTVVPGTTLSPAKPATPPLAVIATTTPDDVVTIVRYVSFVRDVKDSDLLFSLQVPVEWNVSTHRIGNPENFVGFMYQTDIVANNTFYIHTFTDYRSRDQNYRDECRRWSPAPNVTVVTINGMTFDRFESTMNGSTNVVYVARKTSVNDHGYLSVLAFSADPGNRFEKEDYEKVVASFRYHGKDDVSTMPGAEIPKIAPPVEEGGNMRSAVGGGSSSGGSSSGGCGCHG